MKLRRETGDFQIEATADNSTGSITYNTIRPALPAEDFNPKRIRAYVRTLKE